MCSNKKDCLSEDHQELRIGTERVCASTVGPKVATPCQAQLHAERVFLHSRTQGRNTMLNTTDVQTYVCAGTVGPQVTTPRQTHLEQPWPLQLRGKCPAYEPAPSSRAKLSSELALLAGILQDSKTKRRSQSTSEGDLESMLARCCAPRPGQGMACPHSQCQVVTHGSQN